MKKGSLPITVAITGHRDIRLEDISAVEAQVRNIFRSLNEQYPASPITILSSLAEGADRMVARIALEQGLKLICPLPMKKEIYEEDFTTAESKKEFEDFLASAEEWFELPVLQGATLEEIKQRGVARDHQYAYVGAYLARHSQIIIALWDGSPIELVGGTTYIVGFKLKGIPPPYLVKQGRFDPEEIGPVYHVLSPRISHEVPAGIPGSLRIIYPAGFKNEQKAKESYERILRTTNRFNEDEIAMNKKLFKARKQSATYLAPDRKLDTRSEVLVSHFSLSDTLAIYFQKQTLKMLGALFSFALLATIVFELYAYLMIGSPILLVLFFVILAGAYGLYMYSAKKGYQEKFLDYRTLAEGLRIQFFWQSVGLSYSAANYYLGDQHSELDWIRHALRIWVLPFSEEARKRHNKVSGIEKERWDFIMKNWINSQYDYFVRSSLRENKKVSRLNTWARISLLVGFALIAYNMLYQYFIGYLPLPVLLYISSVTPIAAGLFYGYSEKRALADHVKQYERMAALFSSAKERLEQLTGDLHYEEARDLVFDLGKEALKENGRWVITHRERPIEFPITQ